MKLGEVHEDMQVFIGIYIRVESTRGNPSKQKRLATRTRELFQQKSE